MTEEKLYQKSSSSHSLRSPAIIGLGFGKPVPYRLAGQPFEQWARRSAARPSHRPRDSGIPQLRQGGHTASPRRAQSPPVTIAYSGLYHTVVHDGMTPNARAFTGIHLHDDLSAWALFRRFGSTFSQVFLPSLPGSRTLIPAGTTTWPVFFPGFSSSPGPVTLVHVAIPEARGQPSVGTTSSTCFLHHSPVWLRFFTGTGGSNAEIPTLSIRSSGTSRRFWYSDPHLPGWGLSQPQNRGRSGFTDLAPTTWRSACLFW